MPKDSALKVALIGCGRMGALTADKLRRNLPAGWLPLNHAEAIAENPDLNLCALCDVNRESLEATAARLGVAGAYTDYKEMITRERPDVVSIATRTPGRVDIIKFAADNGVRGVHSEKPLAQSLGDCLDAIESMEKRRVAFSYGTYRRYMEIYRRAAAMVREGEIGPLREISMDMGPTMLLWNHPHSVDLILMFAGEAKPEMVWADCKYDPTALHDMVLDADPIVRHGHIGFSDDIVGSITSFGGLNLRIGGADGILEVVGDGTRLVTHKRHHDATGYFLNRTEMLPPPVSSGTSMAFADLLGQLSGQGDPHLSLEDVELSTRVTLSLAYSTVRGCTPVDPWKLPTDFRVTGKFGDFYA